MSTTCFWTDLVGTTQVCAVAQEPAGLSYVANFEGAVGSDIVITSGLSRQLVLASPAPVIRISDERKKFGATALRMQSFGSGSPADIQDFSPAPMPVTSSFRIEFFILNLRTSENATYVRVSTSNFEGGNVGVSWSGLGVSADLNDFVFSTVARPMVADRWYHVCIQGTAATGNQAYVDGVLVRQTPAGDFLPSDVGTVWLSGSAEFGVTSFVDSLRVTADGAVYPQAGFAPPTAPLTP